MVGRNSLVAALALARRGAPSKRPSGKSSLDLAGNLFCVFECASTTVTLSFRSPQHSRSSWRVHGHAIRNRAALVCRRSPIRRVRTTGRRSGIAAGWSVGSAGADRIRPVMEVGITCRVEESGARGPDEDPQPVGSGAVADHHAQRVRRSLGDIASVASPLILPSRSLPRSARGQRSLNDVWHSEEDTTPGEPLLPIPPGQMRVHS